MSRRIGEMVTSDPPGSYGEMNEWDKMELTGYINELHVKARERTELEEKTGQSVIKRVVEIEGEQ